MKLKLDFNKLNGEFEMKTPQDIVSWAVKQFKPHMALSSSFGAQSALLIHMCTQIDPEISVLFVDTGFLFKETYEFAEQLKQRFHLNLKIFRPSEKNIAMTKERLKNGDPRCCEDGKVEAMQNSLEGVKCWIAGLMRGQAESRKNVKIVEEYESGLIKVHPIATWTLKDVHAYMTKYNLPYHPLWEKGYTSIGCEPCTRKPSAGKDDRSGRWAGHAKTECGIHTFMKKKENQS